MDILLSVVIPTFGRPDLLERAINSALLSSINGSVEVLVIPNGPSDEWKTVESLFYEDSKVRFIYCEKSNGNAARDLGLKESKGKYIRFLDDDDYLYHERASEQLIEMIESDADVSSGMIEIIDESGESYGICTYPEIDDFVAANMKVSGITLPTANVYKRESVNNGWDDTITRAQDYIFLLDYISNKEVRWVKYHNIVGIWFQHTNARVSVSANGRSFLKWNFERLIKMYFILMDEGRINEERFKSISEAAWRFIENNYGLNKKTCSEYIDVINENGFVHNKVGENLFKNKLFVFLFKKHPMLYIRSKWFFLSVFGRLRDSLKNKSIRKI